MQVLCIASQDNPADIACSICGQPYAIYYSRSFTPECADALKAVRDALIAHHAQNPTPAAHPADCFNVPEWKGLARMSGAALLSGAPLRPAPLAAATLEAELAS